MNKISLKTKAYILHFAMSAVIAIPGLVFTLLAVICYHIPPAAYFRDQLGVGFANLIADLLDWRKNTVYWYVVDQKQGFSASIED